MEEKRDREYYIEIARAKKDEMLRKRAEAAVSRNCHMPIAKFTQEHLDKVEALYIQLKERQHGISK